MSVIGYYHFKMLYYTQKDELAENAEEVNPENEIAEILLEDAKKIKASADRFATGQRCNNDSYGFCQSLVLR